MTARHRATAAIVCAVLLLASTVSCVKVRGPGIMPAVSESGLSQWKVLNTGFLMVQTNSGQKQWQWQIIARFLPDKSAKGLKPLDIVAAVDGAPVPFTFEEEGQIFESVTMSTLSPGDHRFELSPAPTSTRSFPTLAVDFKAP